MRFRDLWSLEGTVDRSTYVLVGLIGFALKHNIDRAVATFGFAKPWGFFNYWISPFEISSIASLSDDQRVFLLTMVAVSLPFIWVGVVLTLKRLRSIGLPGWCVCFFFLPFLNLLFFVLLAALPANSGRAASIHPGPELTGFGRLIPQTEIGGMAMGVAAANLLAVPFTALAIQVFSTYGFGLFVGIPFSVGLISVLTYAYHAPRRIGALLCGSDVGRLGLVFAALRACD